MTDSGYTAPALEKGIGEWVEENQCGAKETLHAEVGRYISNASDPRSQGIRGATCQRVHDYGIETLKASAKSMKLISMDILMATTKCTN